MKIPLPPLLLGHDPSARCLVGYLSEEGELVSNLVPVKVWGHGSALNPLGLRCELDTELAARPGFFPTQFALLDRHLHVIALVELPF